MNDSILDNEINNIKSIVASQVSCDPMDLYSIKHVTELSLELCKDRSLKKDLVRIMNLYDLVVKSGVGYGVDIKQDENGKLISEISHGHSLYLYVTDNQNGTPVSSSSSYQETVLDIIGEMKDGDIHMVELYIRKCFRIESGDPTLDQHLVSYNVDGEIYKAVDKDSLARMVDFKLKQLTMEEYVTVMADVDILPDKTYGEGNNYILVQQNMNGTVTKVMFNELTSEIIDAMLYNTLLKFKYIDPNLVSKNS